MITCECITVTASLIKCKIMVPNLEDCVICNFCKVHVHISKGSRHVLPSRPIPYPGMK